MRVGAEIDIRCLQLVGKKRSSQALLGDLAGGNHNYKKVRRTSERVMSSIRSQEFSYKMEKKI